jgi:hypothetical protein
MSRYKKPEIDESALGVNPFLSGLTIKVNKKITGDKFKQDGEFWSKADVEFEAAPFCKIFSDSERRLKMVSLHPRAKDLLLWVIFEANANKDWLWINKVRYMEENRVSSINTYKAAVNELMQAGFITRTVITDVFWINPHYFFAGNRITKFKEHVKLRDNN